MLSLNVFAISLGLVQFADLMNSFHELIDTIIRYSHGKDPQGRRVRENVTLIDSPNAKETGVHRLIQQIYPKVGGDQRRGRIVGRCYSSNTFQQGCKQCRMAAISWAFTVCQHIAKCIA